LSWIQKISGTTLFIPHSPKKDLTTLLRSKSFKMNLIVSAVLAQFSKTNTTKLICKKNYSIALTKRPRPIIRLFLESTRVDGQFAQKNRSTVLQSVLD